MPWAVTFTDPLAPRPTSARRSASRSIRRSSTKPGAELIILIALARLRAEGPALPGPDVLGLLLLYAISRFVIEFYRGDARGIVFGMLSTSQFISVLLVPLSLIMLFYLSRRGGRAELSSPTPSRRPRPA